MTTTDIPYGLAYCFATKEQCARCEKCSHSIVAKIPTDDLQPVWCIHPLYINKVVEGRRGIHKRPGQTILNDLNKRDKQK